MPHNVELPEYVVDRVMEKRGRRHVFDRFEAPKTALLVIDMQNFFVAGVAAARSIVPNINRLAAGLRERGALVVWVVMTVADSPDGPSKFPIYHDYFFTVEKAKAHKAGLTNGSEGHRIVSDLDVREDEPVVHKSRFSAFIQGSSDLDPLLRRHGIENLVVVGTLTNVCCESTARDAMMIGYRTVMVSDGNASRHNEDHLAGLTTVYQSFADVRTTDEVLGELLASGAEATQAAE